MPHKVFFPRTQAAGTERDVGHLDPGVAERDIAAHLSAGLWRPLGSTPQGEQPHPQAGEPPPAQDRPATEPCGLPRLFHISPPSLAPAHDLHHMVIIENVTMARLTWQPSQGTRQRGRPQRPHASDIPYCGQTPALTLDR